MNVLPLLAVTVSSVLGEDLIQNNNIGKALGTREMMAGSHRGVWTSQWYSNSVISSVY